MLVLVAIKALRPPLTAALLLLPCRTPLDARTSLAPTVRSRSLRSCIEHRYRRSDESQVDIYSASGGKGRLDCEKIERAILGDVVQGKSLTTVVQRGPSPHDMTGGSSDSCLHLFCELAASLSNGKLRLTKYEALSMRNRYYAREKPSYPVRPSACGAGEAAYCTTAVKPSPITPSHVMAHAFSSQFRLEFPPSALSTCTCT